MAVKWTSEAKELIKAAPLFVQPMIRKSIEKQAAKEGLSQITAEFVTKLREAREGGSSSEKKLSDFYASGGDDPLVSGFPVKGEFVHPGGKGDAVSTEGLWKKISQVDEKAGRRALYIHIPFCVARCLFCPFYQSRTRVEELADYAGYIRKELSMVSGTVLGDSMPLNAIYLGGGTPTDLSAQDLSELIRLIRDSFPVAGDCEITVEGRINGFTDKKVEACLNSGVNRFSFGVQSFNTAIRQQMGRIENRETILKRLEEISSDGRAMISVDLIYGLPDQIREIWMEDLRTVTDAHSVDSVSIYNLKNLPGSPIQSMVDRGKLSKPASMEEQAALFRVTRDFMGNQSCKRLGLRHWAFSNRERSIYNFIPKYNHSCIPVGNGAGGSVGGYSIYQKMNPADYRSFIDRGEKPIAVASKVSELSLFEGLVAGGLEEFRMVNLRNLQRETGDETIVSRMSPLLDQWHGAGIVHWDHSSGVMRMTEAGEFHNVQLIQNFIEYNTLSRKTGGSSEKVLTTEEKIQKRFREKPGALPASVAAEFGITERDVVRHLPDGMSVEAPGRDFKNIWETMLSWGKVTSIVTNTAMIAEVKGSLSSGKEAQGYFNLFDSEAPLNGHIRADRIESIFFVSKKVMGMDSHSVQFFTSKGDKVLSVYLGRDEKKAILKEGLKGYRELRKTYEA